MANAIKEFIIEYEYFGEVIKLNYTDDIYFVNVRESTNFISIIEFTIPENRDAYLEGFNEDLIHSKKWIPINRIIKIELKNKKEDNSHNPTVLTCNTCGFSIMSTSYGINGRCKEKGCYGRYRI